MYIVDSILAIVLLIMFYQDIKFRGIDIFLFPILLIFSVISGLARQPYQIFLIQSGINILFVTAQFLLLLLFSLGYKRNISSSVIQKIGLGDILIIFLMSFVFSTINYLLFYLLSLSLTLIVWLIIKPFLKSNREMVPLAGFMALFGSVVIIADLLIRNIDRLSDYFSNSLIN